MYVCVCKGVTDKQLKCAITEGGMCSRKQIRECLGVGTQCGKCNRHLKSILSCHLHQKECATDSGESETIQIIVPESNLSLASAI